MNDTFTQWYAISLGSVAIATIVFSHLGLVFLWPLYTYSKDLFYWRFWYPLLIQRRYWGSISRGQGFFIAVYIAVNGFCMGLGVISAESRRLYRTQTRLVLLSEHVSLLF